MTDELFMELIDNLATYELLQVHSSTSLDDMYYEDSGVLYFKEKFQNEYNEIFDALEQKWSGILNYDREAENLV